MIDVAANPSDAVEKALDLFGNDILRLAYSYMKSREDAEDIVQEVLIRLMQSAGVFEDESHEKAWLLKVASNLCKDKLKSASRQREVAIPEEKKETTIRSLLKRGREKLARILPQQMKGDDGHAAGI